VERIRAQIDQLVATDRDLGDALEDVARLGARLLLQTALEVEVTEFLGRDRYARGERARAGHRNGHAELTVKSTAGPITLARPKLRGTSEPFASRLLGKGVARSNALESLVIAGFVRGLSVRDVEATLADALGPRRRCRSRPSARSAKRSATRSPHGASGGWTTSSSTICTWTARTASCTPARVPSRSWSPGAAPPVVCRCCWAWPRPPARPTTPGPGSWPAWSAVGCGHRC
jgi:hypothetical protein